MQLTWEAIVNWISQLVRDNIGHTDRNVIQLAIMLFTLILLSNWLELIPSNEYLPAPTSDLNLTLALALIVIFGVHYRSIRSKGFVGYIKHYFQPIPVLFPLNFIEELVKPFTLALRLFGNIFAGGLMLAIIGLIPIWANWPLEIVWKLFDMAIGGIQAFIFALLTVIYFAQASESHPDEDTALLETEEASESHAGGDRRTRHGVGPPAPAATGRSALTSQTDRPTAPTDLLTARPNRTPPPRRDRAARPAESAKESHGNCNHDGKRRQDCGRPGRRWARARRRCRRRRHR